MEVVPPRLDAEGPTGSSPAPSRDRHVLLCGSRPQDPPFVVEALNRAGFRPERVEGLPAVGRSRMGGIALVRLGLDVDPDPESLRAVRLLKHSGFAVAAWEEGLSRWPLRRRCRPLLEGAVLVLDAALPAFGDELARFLSRCLREAAEREKSRERIRSLQQELGIVGSSPSLEAALRDIVRLSPLSDLPVLLTGETGSGKELLARGIHRLDPKRRNGPFVAVNCGSLPAGLMESELFGHRRGAFTGAERDRAGLVRAAEGGILFLDEVGEMEASLQTKLLRILQEYRVLAVGEDRDVPVDVRIVAATHQDLRSRVHEGSFRADLYHRLNVLRVHLPPLRERPEDVEPLVRHFVRKHASLCGGTPPDVAPEIFEALANLPLPGNVRQLENLVRQAIFRLQPDSPLALQDLPTEVWEELSRAACDTASETGQAEAPALARFWNLHDWKLRQSLRHVEKHLLEAALLRTRGNRSETARLLGLSPRCIYSKLRSHGLLSAPR